MTPALTLNFGRRSLNGAGQPPTHCLPRRSS